MKENSNLLAFLKKEGARLCPSLIVLAATAAVLVSCSVAPSEHDIREIIEKYYNQRNLKVVKLALGEVRSQPIGDRTYMGTPQFTVHVRTLTLQATEDSKNPSGRKKGDFLDLKDGVVTIKENPARKGIYLLVSISSSIAP